MYDGKVLRSVSDHQPELFVLITDRGMGDSRAVGPESAVALSGMRYSIVRESRDSRATCHPMPRRRRRPWTLVCGAQGVGFSGWLRVVFEYCAGSVRYAHVILEHRHAYCLVPIRSIIRDS